MHLIERYSLSTGLQIDNPKIVDHFYPIDADKYIVFHTSAKDSLRDYDYWKEVKGLLQPMFHKNGLKTVQIGLEKDPSVDCDIDLRGKTTINQMANVIKNCHYFIGVDSFPAHLAGFYNKKMLAIYANSYSACVHPYWGDPKNQKIIETHRPNGEKPSFSFDENPKTINRLKPSELAAEFADLVDSNFKPYIPQVVYIGDKYRIQQTEVVPDHPYVLNQQGVCVRMDFLHNEQNLFEILKNATAIVVTKQPLNDAILNTGRVLQINYVADFFDPEFVKKVQSKGIDLNLICSSEHNLQNERYRFFDYRIFHFSEKNKINQSQAIIKDCNLDELLITSNKIVIKNQKQYNSHYLANSKANINDLLLDIEWVMLSAKPEKYLTEYLK